MTTLFAVLQLCKAEISDVQQESWYSANIINEGYHPKPISELFSTEATFSKSNPIIILPKSSVFPDQIIYWSTYAPPLAPFSRAGTSFPKTVSMSTPSPILTSSEEIDTTSSTTSPTSLSPKSTLSVLTHTESEISTVEPPIKLVNQEIQLTQQARLKESNKNLISSSAQTTPLVAESNSDTITSIENVPINPQTSSVELIQTKSTAETFSESTIIPQYTSSTVLPSTVASSTSPSTVLHETISNSPFSSPTYPTSSNSFASINPKSTIFDIHSSTVKPGLPLKFGVFTPRGTLTNLKVKPTRMTKISTTTRTRKPKLKNLYRVCTDSCEGSRAPICAAPLSKGLIDPSTLKGFASICHMACHNTFKEERKSIYLLIVIFSIYFFVC